eukprot:202946_1
MHGIINNGFTIQKHVIKEHIYSIYKFITWIIQCTTLFSLFTSLWCIFVNSNAIDVRDIHYPAHVIKGNGQKDLFLSVSAVFRTPAHQEMEQGQKERLWTDKDRTNSKKKKKMAFIKDLDVLEKSGNVVLISWRKTVQW